MSMFYTVTTLRKLKILAAAVGYPYYYCFVFLYVHKRGIDDRWIEREKKRRSVCVCVRERKYSFRLGWNRTCSADECKVNWQAEKGPLNRYRVFIKYCVSLKCCNFSELCQCCCSAGV